MKQRIKVLGVHRVSFTNDDGDRVSGQQLFWGAPTKDPSWNGYEVAKVWFADDHPKAPAVSLLSSGDVLEAEFNRTGKQIYDFDLIEGE